MTTAAIYIRVSTEDQVGNNSLSTQLEACKAYAQVQQLSVVATLSDDETGANTNRRGYQELQRLVREKLIGAVVVYSSDRLHRNLVNQVVARTEFQQAGVDIHYVRRGKLDDTPEGILLDNIDATFAEYERHKIRERTTRGTKGKVDSGRPIGGGRPPYGYDYEGSRRDRVLVVQEDQAAIVHEVFQRYVQGEKLIDIVRHLSERQVPTWSDIHGIANRQRRQRDPYTWNVATLYDMMRDELYAGVWQQFRHRMRNGVFTRNDNPGDWVGVPVPAIVSRDTWQAAQERLRVGRNTSTRNVQYTYGLRSMIRCAACHAAMIGMTQKRPNTQQSYYRCNNSTNKAVTRCDGAPYVRAERADAATWMVVRGLLDPKAMAREQARQAEQQASSRLTAEGQRAKIQGRQQALLTQIDRLVALYGRGTIDIDSIERQIGPLREQIAELGRQLRALELPPVVPVADMLAIIEQLLRGLTVLDENLVERRNACLLLRVKVVARRAGKMVELSITSMLNVVPILVSV